MTNRIEEAIREEWAFRRWYRETARRIFEPTTYARRWGSLAAENDANLRRHVRALRELRGGSR